MAATISGVFPVCLDQQQSSAEGAEMKKKQLALMEKLRNKRSSHRSWTESLKSIRTAVVDRRLQADTTERSQVQKCLDTLQRAMKVISQQSLVERLESVARQQGLTFQIAGGEQLSVTLQADMFYVEVVMNKGGGVKEVKVAHQGDASVCPELTEILSRGDFAEFTSHLEGLQSIYKVTGEKKLKSKAYLALQSLERDLNQLAQFQSSISGVANYIHKSPLGILLPRTAGKPMKLIYFVSPYDLLDKKTLSAHPMTVEAITEHGLGRSVTVCLEPGPPSKLQTMPLLMVSKTADSKSLPSFSPWNHMNSATLPAVFTLVLPQPIPIAVSILQKIKSLTELDVTKDVGSQSLLSLILDSNSGGKIKKDQRLFVSLPDQHHVYFINSVTGGPLEEPGVMVSRIPFTHPTHVPAILNLLRQQLLFNSILASCVRPVAKKDPSCCLVFELTVVSLQQLTVVFEHPAYDTMVTVDIDLSDLTSLKCRMFCSGSEQNLCSDDFAARVLQRCLSLPVLFWAMVRRGRGQLEKLMEAAKALALEQARRAREAAEWAAAQMRQPRVQPTTIPTKGRPPPPQPPPHQTPSYPPTPSPVTSNPPSVGGMGDLRGLGAGVDLLGSSPPGYNMAMMGAGGDSMDKLNNPLLANLLDNERGHPSPASLGTSTSSATVTESPMLSKLLEDNISVATNVNPIPVPPMQQKVNKRVRKRKSQSELQPGRSPKRASEGDAIERIGSVDLESSSSPFESSLGSGGMGYSHQMGGPGRPPSQGHMSGVIDLTDENMPESSLKKLVDFTHKESKPGGMTPESELTALLNEADAACSPTILRNNQSTGPKNENASTSPEGVLTGSGEVGKASSSDPLGVFGPGHAHGGMAGIGHPSMGMVGPHGRSLSNSNNPTTLAAFLGHGQVRHPRRESLENTGSALKQQLQQQPPDFPHHPHLHQVASSTVGVSATSPVLNPRPKVVSSSSMTDMMDIKPNITGKKGGLKPSNSTDAVFDKRSNMGLFEKFEFAGQSLSIAPSLSTSSGAVSVSSGMQGFEGEDAVAPKVRLKLTHPFRTPHGKSQSLDSAVVQSPSSAGSKSSNSNTFDFRSDEEDDDPMPMNYVPSAERLSVYASSPTRLQISSKGKPPTPVSTPTDSPTMKPEKYKRKDKGSGGSTKRKKDREDSKREKKKKKQEHMGLYQSKGTETVYHAATIEGDQKFTTKLKIRVSKELIKTPSPEVSVSKETSRIDRTSERVEKLSEKINDVVKKQASGPCVEKLMLSKQEIREQAAGQEMARDRGDAAQVYRSGMVGSGKSPKGTGGKGIGNSALSKTDPKLAKATIRLKPLNMPTTTSTTITLTSPTTKTTASGSRSLERPRNPSLASTPVSTPTSGTLSLSSILPNAPTASSVASLPPIPKLSASANTTSTASKTASSNTSSNVGKNSPASINSTFGNPSPKVTGSPKVSSNPSPKMSGGSSNVSGSGGRPPNVANTSIKSSPNYAGTGVNKMPGTGNIRANMGGPMHRNFNASGGQKFSSTSTQGVGGQRMSSPSGQGSMKPNMPNQYGAQRMANNSGQMGGSQRGPAPFGQGGAQRPSSLMNQGTSPQRTVGAQSAGVGQKVGSANQTGVQKSGGGAQQAKSNIQQQGGLNKGLGMQGQNAGFQKGAGVQGGPTHKTGVGASTGPSGLNKNLSGSQSSLGQKNNTQGSMGQKSGSMTSSPNQGQKMSGNQGRSLSTGSGRGAVRNNSVSGTTGHTPPNHLPINRSMSQPGQRSGSSPRTPAGQSPSTPSAPPFPSSSPQRNVGSSPSSISQRSSSSSQASTSQKNTGVSQSNASSQRPSGGSQTSHRPGASPQSSQRQSPTQRPASTPSTGDLKGGAGQSPGHPSRPSSAGPRQTSSPLASRTSSPSSSQRLNSSPSRTSSPSGHKQGTGSSSGTSSGISPLVSRSLSGSGGRDSPSLSRQNSSGNLSAPSVSRQNSNSSVRSGSTSGMNASASHHTSAGNVSVTSSASKPSLSSSSSHTVSSASAARVVTTTSSSVSSANSATTSSVRQHSTSTVSSANTARPASTAVTTNTTSPSINTSMGSKPSVSSISKPAVSTVNKPVVSNIGKPTLSGVNKPSVTTSASKPSMSTTPSSKNAISKPAVSSNISKSLTATTAAPKNAPAGNNTTVVSNKSTSGTSSSDSTKVTASSGGTNVSKSLGTVPVTRSVTSTSSGVSVQSTSSAVSATSGTSKPATISASTASTVTSAIVKPVPSVGTISTAQPTSTSSGPTTATSTSKTVSAPRGRKGSLSAIVSKLATKACAEVSVSGTEGGEGASESGSGDVTSPKVLPAAQVRRHSAVDTDRTSEQQASRAPVKRPASISSLSPPSVEHKLQRMDSFSKSSAGTPTTMPSPAHSTPPQHFITTPTTPTALVPGKVPDRRSSLGERSSSTASTHEPEEFGLDLSMPKDRSKQDTSQPVSRPDSRDRVSPKDTTSSVGNATVTQSSTPPLSSEKTQAVAGSFSEPKVGVGNTKFNGDSSREKSRTEAEVFKVPTPKPQTAEDSEDRGGSVPENRASSSSRQPPASPMSDASSPGNDLVIDCGESPNFGSRPSSSAAISTPPPNPVQVQPSPKRITELASEGTSSLTHGRSSPVIPATKTAASPTFKPAKNSPQPSPHPKTSSQHNSPLSSPPAQKETSANSPCEIDDELMDAALMGIDPS